MNAKRMAGSPKKPSFIPEPKTVVMMPAETRKIRKMESFRLLRQANHFNSLLDHILNVKNNGILRTALKAHYYRLSEYCEKFVGQSVPAANVGSVDRSSGN